MVIQVLILIAGFLLLVKGADWFVDGAASLAERMGIPQLVVGLTIVAMGTSMPEAAVSIASALKNNPEIAIGNVVGSNTLNILLILGLTALIHPIRIQRSTIRYEMPFMIAVTLLLTAFGISGSRIQPYRRRYLLGIVYPLFCISILAEPESPKSGNGRTERFCCVRNYGCFGFCRGERGNEGRKAAEEAFDPLVSGRNSDWRSNGCLGQ